MDNMEVMIMVILVIGTIGAAALSIYEVMIGEMQLFSISVFSMCVFIWALTTMPT